MKYKKNILVLPLLFFTFILSSCDLNHDNKKDPDDFRMENAAIDATLKSEPITYDRIYSGSAEVTRYGCTHTAKIDIVLAPDNGFVMKVSTPTVGDNCKEGDDFETAKISGSVRASGDEVYFSKCNQNATPPEGLANYNLKKMEGAVSCYDQDASGKTSKWLSVVFNANRVEDGK